MTPVEITILATVVIANFVLAALVYTRNPGNATHRLFSLLTLFINGYIIVNFLSLQATSEHAALWLTRLVMFFAAPLSVFFFLFIHTFPRASLSMSKKVFWSWIVMTGITMVVALSPYLFTTAELVQGAPPKPTPGPGMIAFIPTGVATIPLGIFYLIKKLRKAKGIERTQMQFLLLGVSIMFTLIIALIFIGTVVLGDSRYAQYAPLFTVPFVALTTYVMIRHRLMDIRLAVFRVLSFLILIGSFFLIYGAFALLFVPYLADITSIRGDLIAAGFALVSIPIARLVHRVLTKMTDRVLFQSQPNYAEALARFGRDLSATIDIREATEVVLNAIKGVIKTRKAVILLYEPNQGTFHPQAIMGLKNFQVVIPSNHVLPDHLRHTQSIAVRDEVILLEEKETSRTHKEELKVIRNTFEWLDMAVVIPLFVNKELTGLILLGEKLSGTPYSKGDLEFLSTFASQAGVNLENARLYTESLKFGKKLEEEVKRATQELEAANMQLKNLDKAKSEFLSIASHQLRTPLTALRGYVSMIKEGDFGEVPEKQQPVLDILDKSATRLIDLINSLLDISRIESGRLELNLESVDLTEMANELVRDLIPNAIAKKLELEFHQPKQATPHVVVDKQRIRQVMLNFIDNAIKYTEKGRVDVYVAQEGDQVVFWVEDTGKGISKDDLARLFNKFTRVGGASRFHTEGTGLGLYVARQIVKEHRGEVHVDSEGEGKGSTFAMNLPAEGTPNSLKPGEKAQVTIKAAEAGK